MSMPRSRKILVTGSSGYLGSALVRRLKQLSKEEIRSLWFGDEEELEELIVVGIDVNSRHSECFRFVPTATAEDPEEGRQDGLPMAQTTTHVGSVADRDFIKRVFDEFDGFHVVFHTATLHQPHLKTHSRTQFVEANVTGTLNLLEEASAGHRTTPTKAFIYTSTTSLMISKAMLQSFAAVATSKQRDTSSSSLDSDSGAQGTQEAFWIDEESLGVPVPRNIYGVTKLAAEHLTRLLHEQTGMPTLILRTSRFFPEPDNDPSSLSTQGGISELNVKLNEHLYRRASLFDLVEAHLLASAKVFTGRLRHDTFVLSSPSPFHPSDCKLLGDGSRGPALALDLRVEGWRAKYEALGFTLPPRIDRVYCSEKAQRFLEWKPKWTFETQLEDLWNRFVNNTNPNDPKEERLKHLRLHP